MAHLEEHAHCLPICHTCLALGATLTAHFHSSHQRALMEVLYGLEFSPLGIGLNASSSASFIAKFGSKKSGPTNAQVFLVVAVAVILELFCGAKSAGGPLRLSLDIVSKFELCATSGAGTTLRSGALRHVCTEYSRTLTTRPRRRDALVLSALETIAHFDPLMWVIENPLPPMENANFFHFLHVFWAVPLNTKNGADLVLRRIRSLKRCVEA